MTSAISSFGTLLKIGNGGGPETFTTIAEVTDITGPGLSMETVEVTSHDSTSGWDEYVGGLLRGGDVKFEINYVPTNATHNATAGLINDMENRTKRNFQLVFPNGSSTTWTFAALVNGFEPKAPVNGKLAASVSLRLSGVPTLA